MENGKMGKGAGKHVSAHFTAQAFSLNKMLSGGEKATDKKQRQLMKGKGKGSAGGAVTRGLGGAVGSGLVGKPTQRTDKLTK